MRRLILVRSAGKSTIKSSRSFEIVGINTHVLDWMPGDRAAMEAYQIEKTVSNIYRSTITF
jgi:hypothetical protein